MKPKATEQWMDAASQLEPAVWWAWGACSMGGRLSPLEEAAGALLRPRGLGAQDGPDRLIEDGFEASLGEGRALQVFHRVWVRQQEGRGLGQGRVLGKTPSQATQLHQAVGATWAVSVRAGNFPVCASASSCLKRGY